MEAIHEPARGLRWAWLMTAGADGGGHGSGAGGGPIAAISWAQAGGRTSGCWPIKGPPPPPAWAMMAAEEVRGSSRPEPPQYFCGPRAERINHRRSLSSLFRKVTLRLDLPGLYGPGRLLPLAQRQLDDGGVTRETAFAL